MLANSYFWLFAALFDFHLHLVINVLSFARPRERLLKLINSLKTINKKINCFLINFKIQ